MNDRCLQGTYTIAFDDDYYPGSETRVGSGCWRIENDAGAWEGSYMTFFPPHGSAIRATTLLSGEGAHEGLTVIWETETRWDACAWDVRGLIVDGVPAP
jgi:hypothetical protein